MIVSSSGGFYNPKFCTCGTATNPKHLPPARFLLAGKATDGFLGESTKKVEGRRTSRYNSTLQQVLEEPLPLTVVMLVGQPRVLAVVVGVVGVALGALLGTEILVGPRALLAVAHLVLVGGSRAVAPTISRTRK